MVLGSMESQVSRGLEPDSVMYSGVVMGQGLVRDMYLYTALALPKHDAV